LNILQRRLSRKDRGSANRRKARFKVARLHNKIVNQRSDFLHKLSNRLVKSYSFMAVEKLKIQGRVKNQFLAKHISDVSWGDFIKNLEYKAVTSGSELVKVNPRNTSKTCSRCVTIIDMPLSKRDFLCINCSLSCHRDLNASRNILRVGTDCAELNACGDFVSTIEQSVANRIIEAGTITTKPSTNSVVGSPII
jgi:putative transposase